MNQNDKFVSFHNNIMNCVHYNDAIIYIVKKWPLERKKALLNDLMESMIKRE